MNKYLTRVADDILSFKLESKGAVLIQGPKWCGKTTTALQQASSVIYLQDSATRADIELRGSIDNSFILDGATPRLIDEWQDMPELWDQVRMEVDRRDDFGQFMLTGSAVPADLSKIRHTGTGRFARLLLRPMSLLESGDSTGQISVDKLFAGEFVEASSGKNTTLEHIAFLLCRGGWPKALGVRDKVALVQAIEYFDGIAESDISRASNVSRSADLAKLIMKSYARNVGSQISYEEILRDIEINAGTACSLNTLKAYIEDLRKIFVIEDCPAWNPNLRSRTAIRTADTRYFMDPSVAAAALFAGPEALVDDTSTMGLLFENLAIRDLRIYASAIGGEVRHYRDRNGLECDAVIVLPSGKFGLVEIKLGGAKLIKDGIATLSKLDELLKEKPAFKMILTAVGDEAFRVENGIMVVPITMLGV